MKHTLRRTLALAAASLAVAVGLGVPTAAPASAACGEISNVSGSAPLASSGYTLSGRVNSYAATTRVDLSAPCGTKWTLTVLDADDNVLLSQTASPRPYATALTFPTANTAYNQASETVLTYAVKVTDSNGFILTSRAIGVVVPNSSFDWQTGDNVVALAPYCPAHVKGSYC